MRAHVLKAVLTAATVLAVFAWPSVASAQEAELEFVAPESVAMSGTDGETDAVSVWLRNESSQVLTPEFEVVLEDSEGDEIAGDVVVLDDDDKETEAGVLQVGRVERYRLILEDDAAKESASGQLVASADRASPASVALTVGPKSVADRGVDGALLIPLAAALVLMLIAWFVGVRGAKEVTLKTPLPTLDLDFKTSFASTLTAVGALLGTIIAAGVLPETTVNLSKDAFTALNLLYGVAIVAAGIVYLAAQKTAWVPKADNPAVEVRKQQGFVGLFLVASTITVWAVLGELYTTWLLVEELGQGDGFSDLGVCIFKVLLGAATLAMASYTVWRIKAIITSERPVPKKGKAKEAAEREANESAGPTEVPPSAQPERVTLL